MGIESHMGCLHKNKNIEREAYPSRKNGGYNAQIQGKRISKCQD